MPRRSPTGAQAGCIIKMKYVYILRSLVDPERFYVGATTDLNRRLAEHNAGESIHTNKYKPLEIKTYLAFDDPLKADMFETFLKTSNGRQFAKKRL